MSRKLLVTSALPYANGDIHIGHLVEYMQTDIWVRFQKSIGNRCHYICASDTHGTPIMINAQKRGVTPEELVETFRKKHQEDFKGFHIEFDYYGSTHSESNRELSEAFYLAAKDKGAIYEKEIDQLYSEKDNMFLPDRFVKGTCPECGAEDQYGDSCEKCGATYSPQDLVNPFSVVSGDTPVMKQSVHYFYKLSQFENDIKSWLGEGRVCEEARKKLQEWFSEGLRDWDISRDEPYFGFKIPGTEDKYFYVWLDAPVGYIASTLDWSQDKALTDEIWKSGDWEIHHFIGKDILYFHCLFWPAMLTAAEYALPTKINIHGFLTVNGEKMSKSRGTFIMASTYLEHLDPDFLRYYYASKLSPQIEDLDLNLEDFVFKINSDVLGKVVNIASRLASIVYKKCDAKLGNVDDEGQVLINKIKAEADSIQAGYETLEYSKTMKQIMNCAAEINKYIDEKAPWSLVKEDVDAARTVCTVGLTGLVTLCIYLAPVMPRITRDLAAFLGVDDLSFSQLDRSIEGISVDKYKHVAARLEQEQVESILGTLD
jgi:methionyl-tRNA synthetase